MLPVVVAATPARADEPPQSPPPRAIVASPPPPPPPPRDYDAADPNRNIVNHLRAAAGVSLVNYLLWQYDWIADKEDIFRVTGRDVVHNYLGGFPLDKDTLNANFFGHPYGGSMYFGAARSSGLGFWESGPYVVGGSVMWEMLSETQKPSANDVVATSLGGIALGEILHRVSSLALDDSRSGIARLTREVLAFGISPTRGATRVVTAEAWSDGAPPIPKYARLVAHAGFDRVAAGTVTDRVTYGPSVVFAIDAEYGDLVPAPSKTTIPVYDFFDFYAAANITSQRTSGFEFSSLGLLHGWSSDVSSDEGPSRDNNVIGFVQSTDFQGTNEIEFAALGLGVGDLLVLRSGPRKRLRLEAEAEWVPLAAVSSAVNPFVGTPNIIRDYNFSMGAALGLGLRWELGRAGHVGLSAREYGTAVVNGTVGEELFGYARLWYEVEAIRDLLGVGLAPKVMHRAGSYSGGRRDQATQLSLQFYTTVRL